MADWTASFKLPKFSDEQFKEQHAKYVEKNGYTVTIPAWDDVIHIKSFPPMTDDEKKLWTGDVLASEIPDVEKTGTEIAQELLAGKTTVSSTRRPTAAEQSAYKKALKLQIPEERRSEIQAEKDKKKARYVAMLGSPAPEILRSVGSIAVAVDNAQDAMATLAAIGMVTGALAGETTAAFLAGPVGWLAGGAALLNMINPMSVMKWPVSRTVAGRAAKRDLEKLTDKNPFSKKAKAKTTAKMKTYMPGMSTAIEALQVTDNLFGVGISLGPIVGVAQDALSGMVRQIGGAQVTYKLPPNPLPDHATVASMALKAQAVIHGIPWFSDLDDEVMSFISANLALQVVTPYLQDWNPMTEIEDLTNVEIQAPRPADVLTLEIIAEMGHNIDDVCNWPQNGEQWITLGELQEKTAPQATANLNHFAEENPNSALAFLAAQNAHDFTLGTIEAIEGPGSVYVEYSHTERTLMIILDNGWIYPDNITAEQIQKFEEWVYTHEYMDTQPSYQDIARYAEIFCGFKWVRSPDETR